MQERLRAAYNAAYSPAVYEAYTRSLAEQAGVAAAFRLAETPGFFPRVLRERLERYANEIADEIAAPALIEKLTAAVPARFDVPRRDALASCIQVDLAVCRDAQGELDAKLVELQGFPSLYAFTAVQARVWREVLRTHAGIDTPLTPYYSGLDEESYRELLGRALLAGHDPREVVLLDLTPSKQKTACDFEVTRRWYGIDAVDPTELTRDGRTLYRTIDGKKVAVRRIYNRVVFDELERKGVALPFAYTDDLDVSWLPHPNWYWIWSKCTIPHLKHHAVPKATLLSELRAVPDDLENYVLKPLFSFAGAGVKVDVTREAIDAVPDAERAGWMLQEKIEYAPALVTPEGHGVKAEVRMMFLRAPDEPRPRLVINLLRLSRGKMLGVDQNRDLDWVGGSVGLSEP